MHTAIGGRILAALVALGLSGAPALLEHGKTARLATHRCHCPAGRHDCKCPVCHAAHTARATGEVEAAQHAEIEKLPPCHRAKAVATLARAPAEEQRPVPVAAPGLRSGCDGPEERLPTSTAQELFVVPGAPVLCAPGFARRLTAPAGTSVARPQVPELPPPRGA